MFCIFDFLRDIDSNDLRKYSRFWYCKNWAPSSLYLRIELKEGPRRRDETRGLNYTSHGGAPPSLL